MGKSAKSLMVAAIVTAILLTFAYFAGSGSVTFAGHSALFLCGLLALAINWLVFIPSAATQADTYYDTTGAITYLTVIAFACYAAWPLDARAMVVAAMVAIWCIRLGSFLFTRIHAEGGTDSRFAKIKTNPARFFVAWTLQALWVTLTAASALAIITSETRSPLGVFFYVGAAVWLFGFIYEVVADSQKRDFKADPANRGKFINTGLWRWSRHPNYFGEITLWTGIFIIAIPVLSGLSWLVVLSPLFVLFLLTKVSGVNLQNAQAKERWSDDPAYQEYRANTPTLIPRPPKG